ncbi:MAG: ribonuclease III, partial [Methylobacterium sp.]|nr:ribonuclease III [Methylobacterium sp.]
MSAEGPRLQSYQRLEFLGDRVLGLCIADMLFARYPTAAEGDMSRRLADLVRKETCAEVAIAWNLGAFMRLGEGEILGGARKNKAILA